MLKATDWVKLSTSCLPTDLWRHYLSNSLFNRHTFTTDIPLDHYFQTHWVTWGHSHKCVSPQSILLDQAFQMCGGSMWLKLPHICNASLCVENCYNGGGEHFNTKQKFTSCWKYNLKHWAYINKSYTVW